ncbi:PREDICTED: melanocyte-stimulating hormone receptor-like, partial [Priapulus caudatus]|uniref:Melanocyte-stimulating hormone receptor-like n=1 Tax=Priapulus caudatus TaxID=37621 RepID=A0ABM1ESG8_PRICU
MTSPQLFNTSLASSATAAQDELEAVESRDGVGALRVVAAAVILLQTALIVCGCLLFVVCLLSNRYLQKLSNVTLTSLVASDALLALVVGLATAIELVAPPGDDAANTSLVATLVILQCGSVLVFVCNLSVFLADKYLEIIYPFKYVVWMTRTIYVVAVVGLWSFPWMWVAGVAYAMWSRDARVFATRARLLAAREMRYGFYGVTVPTMMAQLIMNVAILRTAKKHAKAMSI